MQLCATSLIAAAFTVVLLLADLWNLRSDRMLAHFFLGSLITLLFFGLCQFGYEALNWGFLAIFPVVVFIAWLSTYMYSKSPVQIDDSITSMPDFGNCTSCAAMAKPKPCPAALPTCGQVMRPACGNTSSPLCR